MLRVLLAMASLLPAVRSDADVELISRSVSPPSTGGGESALGVDPSRVCCSISQDGRYLAFVSEAGNLISGQSDSNRSKDVFLRDLALGTTVLVSHSNASPLRAGNGKSSNATTSADGRYVAFESTATDLVATDPAASTSNVYLFDRLTGLTELVSRSAGFPTRPGDSDSFAPVVSADGATVAYLSWATDLVPGTSDSNAMPDVFLFDRAAGSTMLVSHAFGQPGTAGNGACSGSLAVSANGLAVAFKSLSTDLISGQTGTGGNVFLFLRPTSEIVLASHSIGASKQAIGGDPFSLSADGRFVFFSIPYQPVGSLPGSYRFDRSTGDVAQWPIAKGSAVASLDGRWLAYDDYQGIHLQDLDGGAPVLVSHAAGSTSPAPFTEYPTALGISANGRFVLYRHDGNNLVFGQIGVGPLFLFDRELNASVLVSHRPGNPTTGSPRSGQPDQTGRATLSAEGQRVVFEAGESTLVAQDTNHFQDLFSFGPSDGAVTTVSLRPADMAAASANRESRLTASPSANGSVLVFASEATDLVPGQPDLTGRLPTNPPPGYPRNFFWHDRATGATKLINHSISSPSQFANQPAQSAVLSADGHSVAYVSAATDLVPGFPGGSIGDVYVFDSSSGTNTQISRGTTGAGSGGESSAPAISADGRYVAFVSVGTALVPGQVDTNFGLGGDDVFLYDRVAGSMTLVSRRSDAPTTTGNDVSGGPSISADGRLVAFYSRATDLIPGPSGPEGNLFVFDRQTGSLRLASHDQNSAVTPAGLASGGRISADGSSVAYLSSSRAIAPGGGGYISAFLYDMASGNNLLVSKNNLDNSLNVVTNADGRFVAYTKRGSEVAGQLERNFDADVFLLDRVANTRVLVSHIPASATATGDRMSFLAGISADGRFVHFRSDARDIDPSGPGDFIFDRLTGGNTPVWRAIRIPPTPMAALLSADGSHVVFETGDSARVAAGDYNGWQDVFAADIAQGPDVAVAMSGPLSASPGQNLAFSVGVVNQGTMPAETVVLDDPLPAGLLQGPVSGSCASFPCSLGALGVGDSRQVDIGYTIPPDYSAPAPIVNVATATNSIPDIDPTNNTAFAQVTLPSAFHTLLPCRLVDTRDPNGPAGGPALPSGGSRTFTLPGSCGIPAGVKTVALNVTVVAPTSPGFIRVSPVAAVVPQTSTVNFGPGQTRANSAVVSVGVGGQISATLGSASGQAHLILDVVGYFK
jgi:uncharacterized repeat protein (TIGR01451 family)